FTAVVSVQSPGAGTPTGTVQFQVDDRNVGSPVNVSTTGGVTTASFSTATLTVGTHTITAGYSGDGSFSPSSGSCTQTVNMASTSTVLSAVRSSVSERTVTLTATVTISGASSSAAANPTGVVDFLESGVSIGQGTLSTSGST